MRFKTLLALGMQFVSRAIKTGVPGLPYRAMAPMILSMGGKVLIDSWSLIPM